MWIEDGGWRHRTDQHLLESDYYFYQDTILNGQYGHLNIVCLPAIGIWLVNSKCLFLKLPVSKDLCRQETILKLLFKSVLIDSLLCCEIFRKISWTPLAARHLAAIASTHQQPSSQPVQLLTLLRFYNQFVNMGTFPRYHGDRPWRPYRLMVL